MVCKTKKGPPLEGTECGLNKVILLVLILCVPIVNNYRSLFLVLC